MKYTDLLNSFDDGLKTISQCVIINNPGQQATWGEPSAKTKLTFSFSTPGPIRGSATWLDVIHEDETSAKKHYRFGNHPKPSDNESIHHIADGDIIINNIITFFIQSLKEGTLNKLTIEIFGYGIESAASTEVVKQYRHELQQQKNITKEHQQQLEAFYTLSEEYNTLKEEASKIKTELNAYRRRSRHNTASPTELETPQDNRMQALKRKNTALELEIETLQSTSHNRTQPGESAQDHPTQPNPDVVALHEEIEALTQLLLDQKDNYERMQATIENLTKENKELKSDNEDLMAESSGSDDLERDEHNKPPQRKSLLQELKASSTGKNKSETQPDKSLTPPPLEEENALKKIIAAQAAETSQFKKNLLLTKKIQRNGKNGVGQHPAIEALNIDPTPSSKPPAHSDVTSLFDGKILTEVRIVKVIELFHDAKQLLELYNFLCLSHGLNNLLNHLYQKWSYGIDTELLSVVNNLIKEVEDANKKHGKFRTVFMGYAQYSTEKAHENIQSIRDSDQSHQEFQSNLRKKTQDLGNNIHKFVCHILKNTNPDQLKLEQLPTDLYTLLEAQKTYLKTLTQALNETQNFPTRQLRSKLIEMTLSTYKKTIAPVDQSYIDQLIKTVLGETSLNSVLSWPENTSHPELIDICDNVRNEITGLQGHAIEKLSPLSSISDLLSELQLTLKTCDSADTLEIIDNYEEKMSQCIQTEIIEKQKIYGPAGEDLYAPSHRSELLNSSRYDTIALFYILMATLDFYWAHLICPDDPRLNQKTFQEKAREVTQQNILNFTPTSTTETTELKERSAIPKSQIPALGGFGIFASSVITSMGPALNAFIDDGNRFEKSLNSTLVPVGANGEGALQTSL